MSRLLGVPVWACFEHFAPSNVSPYMNYKLEYNVLEDIVNKLSLPDNYTAIRINKTGNVINVLSPNGSVVCYFGFSMTSDKYSIYITERAYRHAFNISDPESISNAIQSVNKIAESHLNNSDGSVVSTFWAGSEGH